MNYRFRILVFFFVLAMACSLTAFGQISSAGSISGTVRDSSTALIPGADVVVKHDTTGTELRTVTADNGTFSIPAVPAGIYTVTVSVTGFKQAVVTGVQVLAATPATVHVVLEIGVQTEQVIVTGGAEVLQTQSANVASTVVGRQITELPFASRDALDLVLLLPGTTTPGRPRTSSVNGLPKGALNITLDGINVQDNLLKSSDGFFTYIRPRIDAMEEVTVSTSTPGAESSGEGAVQIKFVTKSGNNTYHGGVYEYHRNPALNANYWFNNRDLAPDKTGHAPRDRVLLNQYGFKFGGPISFPGLFDGRDKAFFFVNYEEFRLPEQTSRNRTILSEPARQGVFRYNTSSGVQSVNLYNLAASKGQISTGDPVVSKLLSDIRASTSSGAVSALTDPNLENFAYTATGGQDRYFPTVRFDFNLTSMHRLENVWNYQAFRNKVDFLNSTDPRFPGFPNYGGQNSNRFSNSTALRSTLRPNLVNEARFGLQGGITLFFAEIGPSQFNNQGGFSLGIDAAGVTTATASRSPSRRNSPVKQFNDTLTWIKGAHSLNFGFSFSQINLFSNSGAIVPSIGLGVDATDPADSLFVGANFPGASSSDISRARGIYATLVGRVTSIGATAYLDEQGSYQYLGRYIERARQREMGFFVSDSWRWKPNLTLNYGLRWEIQYPFTTLNKTYSQTTFPELYGVSGAGNLFKPGVSASAKETLFTAFVPGDKAYDTKYKNFAPTLGFAWSPHFKDGILRKVFGEGTTTVLRGGYAIAYNREGTNVVSSLLGSNPGGNMDASRNLSLGNLGALPVLLRETSRLGAPSIPAKAEYPLTGSVTQGANAFDPNLRLGYVQSWTLGLQREISKDTVIEFRYIGNHGTKLWRQYNLNEINVIENGMLAEFQLAMANLQANNAAGGARANSFAYYGAGTGTSPLPITLAYFSGIPVAQAGDAAKYNSSNFKSATWTNTLFPLAPAPQTYASNLQSTSARRASALAAGQPANLFVVNPGKLGGSYIVDNGGSSNYHAAAVELRRRLSHGLLVQGSYTWSKGISNMYASSSTVYSDYYSLRKTGLSRGISPWDITHALKVNWIYEMPFGRGKMLFSGAGSVMDRIIGGWAFHGTARIQSGSPFSFGNVNLAGMTVQDLRNAIQIRHDDAKKITYYLPQDIVENTIKAFNYNASGYTSGAPTGRYIRPANGPDCVPAHGGMCGFSNVVVYGPRLVRWDLSAVKKVHITERVDFELRGEFLNAFNNINFRVGSAGNDVTTVGSFGSATFGQTREAYRDVSTTNDPGGRLIQIVARVNF